MASVLHHIKYGQWIYSGKFHVKCGVLRDLEQYAIGGHPFSTYAKNFRKTNNISYPLIRTRTCAYQGVENVCFSEIFGYVLTEFN